MSIYVEESVEVTLEEMNEFWEKKTRERSRRIERNRRRTEKRIRKRYVERYLGFLADADNSEALTDAQRGSARAWLRENEKLLRDCERLEIDRRLGIDGVPTGLSGR